MNKYQERNSKYLRSKDEKKTSKYVREKGEKKQSKFARDKDEKKSKYIRDSFGEVEHHYKLARNFREEEDIIEDEILEEKVENIEALQADELQAEPIAENEVIEANPDRKSIFELMQEAREEELAGNASADKSSKESLSNTTVEIFKDSSHKKDTTVVHIKNETEERFVRITATIAVMTLLTVIACALQFATFRFSFFPTIVNMEISALPEFIASLSYGPVFGILIIIIKNIIHIIISGKGFYAELANLILDTVFVTVGGLFYTRRMFSVNPNKSLKPTQKDMRRKRVFEGGMLAAAVTIFASFFVLKFVSLPLIFKQYESIGIDEGYVVANYQAALDKINSALPGRMGDIITHIDNIDQAILIINVPIQIMKYLFISLVVSFVYVIISPYIHFRKKRKE